jgi:hypothetical protein
MISIQNVYKTNLIYFTTALRLRDLKPDRRELVNSSQAG